MSHVSQELNEIRSLTREFAAAELRPHVETWDRDASFGTDVLAQVAELGFFGMLVPEAHGGMQVDAGTWLAALEELAWGEASIALVAAFHAQAVRLLQLGGDAALQHEWLETLATGRALGCLALAEGESGSHLEGVSTTAVRDGDGWRINGRKRWVSQPRSDAAVIVLARAPEGPTLFLLRGQAEGVLLGARDATLGLRPLEVRTVELRDAWCADGARIGECGGALPLLARAAAGGALDVAAISCGVAQAALDHARDYADVREQFGSKLRRFEGMQFKLADMATRTAAARALMEQAVLTGDESRARMAKLFAAESVMFVTTHAVQVFGGYGYMRDYPVEKLMRDARAMSLLGGADELHRVAIAEALYND